MAVKTSFKVEEGTVQETLMMPLYGRVYCEEHFPNTFPNKTAKETAAKVDYDFGKVKSSELNMVTWGLRARMLQDAAKDYLTKHPKDCRETRIDIDRRLKKPWLNGKGEFQS